MLTEKTLSFLQRSRSLLLRDHRVLCTSFVLKKMTGIRTGRGGGLSGRGSRINYFRDKSDGASSLSLRLRLAFVFFPQQRRKGDADKQSFG